MPTQAAKKRATTAKKRGKSASTQAGEYVREEMRSTRNGRALKGGRKQAVAIGLSQARRNGVKLSAPRKGTASTKTRNQAKRDLSKGRGKSSAGKSRSKSTQGRQTKGRATTASRTGSRGGSRSRSTTPRRSTTTRARR